MVKLYKQLISLHEVSLELTATASNFLTKRADCCSVTCSVGKMADHCTEESTQLVSFLTFAPVKLKSVFHGKARELS